ncbi:(+)-neomenthol dehydrogenase-like [Phragmites australis]|uniref:(+)-neomenthol dehydrogenase-like n=1 Tax=Phragmites australis TaxID=29695 RepID=UPI002D775C2B|nr:(+)-neomenthol dehydrogenase-like [Phragmites australis]
MDYSVRGAWWSGETVAVVTGANRGIGHALAARLAEHGLTVVLTARDGARGEAAATPLRARGLAVVVRHLDVSDAASVADFAAWLRDDVGGLDILVNNAAVSFNEIDTNSVEHAETVLRTNFYGAKMLTEALLPLFRQSPATSRILNISSQLGLLNKVSNPSLKALLQDEDRLTEAAIESMVARFLAQVKDGTWAEPGQGWPKVWTDYSVSKLALNAYSRLLARRLQAHGERVSVNCFCPGFTRTDMTKGWGKRTAEEVADVGARLALLPPGELPTGTFFKWCTPQLYSKL